MVVTREELEELQGVTQKRLKDLEHKSTTDTSVFELQTLDSNISLALSVLKDGDEFVELGTRDKIITEALLTYRAEIAQKSTESAFVGEIAFYAKEALSLIGKITETVPEKEAVLKNNIAAKLSLVEPELKEIVSFAKNDKALSKLRKKDVSSEINPDYKAPVEKAAAKTAVKSVSKSAAKTAVKSTAKTSSTAKAASKAPAKSAKKSEKKTKK